MSTTRHAAEIADSGLNFTGPPGLQTNKRRNLSLANISIPSGAINILKRKPLPANSPAHQKRSASVDSPIQNSLALRPPPPNTLTPIASPRLSEPPLKIRDLDRNPRGTTPLVHPEPTPTSLSSHNLISPIGPLDSPRRRSAHNRNISAPVRSPKPRHDRIRSTRSVREFVGRSRQEESHSVTGTPQRTRHRAMTSISSQPSRLIRIDSDQHDDLSAGIPKTPRSPPARKLSNFFGFRKSPGPDSPSTFYSGGASQPVSPMPGQSNNGYFGTKLAPAALDIPKANASHNYHYMPGTPGLPSPPVSTTHAADLEQELRELSTELANSLRREMDLEDEVERLKEQTGSSNLEAGRRTSDYFSDSGAGSVRYPGDGDGKIEQLERLRRAAEQEKAQLKIQMSDKLQDALNQRREAEERSLILHERLKTAGLTEGSPNSPAELKVQLEETKRKLHEESQFRQNFQDLVGGMRLELEQIKNERDNLRDEVVPQLRTQLEGLETDNAKNQLMTYEHSRMSQELQSLKDENHVLSNARRLQLEMQQQAARFTSIDEEAGAASPSSPSMGGLSRSKSFAVRGGRSSRTNSIISPGGGGLSRAASVKESNKSNESRETLLQRVKDTELQRDALHKALRSLLERHLVQEKKHEKKVSLLQKDLQAAQTLTPRRTMFHEEVQHLREEVSTLRRRAEDALDQKWELEKNFSGVKMDLDRAKEESTSLRSLLDRRDLFLPDRPGSRDGTKALDKAYKELRTTHALSIAHLKEIEATGTALGLSTSSVDAEKTLELLKKSISDAEAERDAAQSQATAYRDQARTLQKSELDHLNKEQSLSAELYASAQRMDDLANQVQDQIQSNSVLRQKLAEALERGEREQKNSAARVLEMQTRLRELEERLVAAQTASESAVSQHEAEVRQLQESNSSMLQRGRNSSANLLLPQQGQGQNASRPPTPGSAIFAPKSPIKRVSMADATQTLQLERKVRELERALRDAEEEMSEVVGRMSKAQCEVAELQGERDEAMMQSRRLQAEYLKEREKVQQLMLTPTTFS